MHAPILGRAVNRSGQRRRVYCPGSALLSPARGSRFYNGDGISTFSSMASKKRGSAGQKKQGRKPQEKANNNVALKEPEILLDDAAEETAEPQAKTVTKPKDQKSKADVPAAAPKEAAEKAGSQAKKDSKPKVPQKTVKEKPKVKRSIDPIIAVCAAVLLLSSVVIIAATIDDKFFSQGDTSAATAWDTVEVDYVGSFYGYYDEGGMVFDTSIESIGTDYLKSYSFERTSYSKLSFTIGQGKMLTGFENALLGMRPGETVRVAIPVGEGYGDGTSFSDLVSVTDLKTPRTLIMTKDECTTYLGSTPTAGVLKAKTPFGWDAEAILDSVSGTYTVIQNPSVDTYKPKADTSDSLDVLYKVTGVTATEITFDYEFSDGVKNKMETTGWHVKALDNEAKDIFIYGQDSGGVLEYHYKYPISEKDANGSTFSTERNDVVLYFEIRFIGYA